MTNVIPGEAWCEIDIRMLPGQPTHVFLDEAFEAKRELEKQEPRLKVDITVLSRHEANSTPEDHPFVRRVQRVCSAGGFDSSLRGLLFFTDAGRVTPTLKIPYVIWGPGDDREAHQIDEKIELSSVHRMAGLYLDLVMFSQSSS